jgi:hypothetical protein
MFIMTNWAKFLESDPALGQFARTRLVGRIAYLATSRADGSPRVHPVSPFIAGDHLFVYMEPTSPKVFDLRRDSRYALHCSVEDNSGGQGESLIRGKAHEITDSAMKTAAFESALAMGYNPLERYVLFELMIGEAMSTVYEDGEPKRARWRASNRGRLERS